MADFPFYETVLRPLGIAKFWVDSASLRLSSQVESQCPLSNVFHACVQRTGSRWLMRVLKDPIVYQYSGLTYQPYSKYINGPDDPRKPSPWRRAFAGPLYMGHWEYSEIPKNGPSRAFFICRDPRDIVTSYYFSTRFAHRAHKKILPRRAVLNELPEREGILKCVEYLTQDRLFERIRSWFEAAESTNEVSLIRYESITGPEQFQIFRDLFDFCEIAIPDERIEEVLDKYSFKKMSKRKDSQKETDVKSHYRSGKAGDWQNHFDDELRAAFVNATGDLVERLGYESHASW